MGFQLGSSSLPVNEVSENRGCFGGDNLREMCFMFHKKKKRSGRYVYKPKM